MEEERAKKIYRSGIRPGNSRIDLLVRGSLKLTMQTSSSMVKNNIELQGRKRELRKKLRKFEKCSDEAVNRG